jgi:hypothetical protein
MPLFPMPIEIRAKTTADEMPIRWDYGKTAGPARKTSIQVLNDKTTSFHRDPHRDTATRRLTARYINPLEKCAQRISTG